MATKKRMDKKTWLETLKQFGELPPPMIEESRQCFHEYLEKFIKDDFAYQCRECRCVIEVVGSAMYTPEQYVMKTATINLMLSRESKMVKKMCKALGKEVDNG